MLQLKVINAATSAYQFVLRHAERSLQKQVIRAGNKLDKRKQHVANLQEAAENINLLAREAKLKANNDYSNAIAEINAATNFVQNVQEDIAKQVRYN